VSGAKVGVTGGGSWVGVNFWSRVGGPRMWVNYDRDVVRQELAVLVEHGCAVTRSFCYWPDFVPEPGRLDEAVFANFEDFLDAHVDAGMVTIPTFIVGHMSGQNWDPVWRHDRHLYRDVWLVSEQAWFAAELTRRVATHPAITGWLISNEMPIYGGPGSIEEVTAWARIMVHAVRAGGGTQPVSLGDGAWGIEVTGQDNGYSLRAIAPLVDFMGPHVYPMADDPLRQVMASALACELSGTFGRPVVLEEFGLTSDFTSDENGARYYRQVLHTSLMAGATGWLAWNNCDYDNLRDQDPYRHHPFEMHFGITDKDGKPKPQLLEMARFSKLVAELDQTGWQTVAGEVAIIVPEYFERELSSTTPEQRTEIRPNLLQSYIAAREADLPVAFVREVDGIGNEAKLLLVPSTKALTGPTLDRLVERATAGATVYFSYFTGTTDTQRGSWLPSLNDVFGIERDLWYGLVDPIETDEVTLEFIEPMGGIEAGSTLSFVVGGGPNGRTFLPIGATDATVVAVDGAGRPALVRRAVGAGSMVLCTYPLEYLAACTPRVNPESTWRLYSALASVAGVELPLAVADPRVMVGRLRTPGSELAILVNSSGAELEVAPIITGDAAWRRHGAAGTDPVDKLTLAPYEVELLTRTLS
jgi:endo-1,4-beta-mannosidase